MTDVLYLNLDKNLIKNGLGGKRHIEGIIESCPGHIRLSVASVDAHNLQGNYSVINLDRIYFYYQIFLLMRRSNFSAVIVRKTLFGMYLFAGLLLILRLYKQQPKAVIEFNGISGDFRIKNRLIRFIFLIINIIPLYFYDYVYAVNSNIRDRIVKFQSNLSEKILVCANGCFIVNNQRCIASKPYSKFQFVFYGSNQDKYHLYDFCMHINKLAEGYHIDLIGYGFESFNEFKNVRVLGAMSSTQFTEYLMSQECIPIGIIPLDNLFGQVNIVPIKAMDYISFGLPVLHSVHCLHSFRGNLSFCEADIYNPSNFKSKLAHFSKILDKPESVRSNIEELRYKYSWKRNLEPLWSALKD
ncbi:hypothetical protein pfor_22c2455 [Rhodobacteraceae bacterium SB2]|nr:hypothetical protein pfor_22c2455 [Rhodobacteraceae bacterium SB2]